MVTSLQPASLPATSDSWPKSLKGQNAKARNEHMWSGLAQRSGLTDMLNRQQDRAAVAFFGGRLVIDWQDE